MLHVSTVGRKSFTNRSYVIAAYALLIVMGITMVVPFMITVAGSMTNDYDYQRFKPVPRFLYSHEDRYMKGLTEYFNRTRDWRYQMNAYIPDAPNSWSSWLMIGEDLKGADQLAKNYLSAVQSNMKVSKLIAKDYSYFADNYDLMDQQIAVNDQYAIEFLRQYYEDIAVKEGLVSEDAGRKELRRVSLDRLSKYWNAPYKDYYSIKFDVERRYPMSFQRWYPPAMDPKYSDYLKVKEAYTKQMFFPGARDAWEDYAEEHKLSLQFPVSESDQDTFLKWQAFKAEQFPASMGVPFALRAGWYKFLLQSEKARELAGITVKERMDVSLYNKLAGTSYDNIQRTPFPIPEKFGSEIQKLWRYYVKENYPLRLTQIRLNDETRKQYATFLQKEIKVMRIANELLGTQHTKWSQFELVGTAPKGFTKFEQNARSLWMNFAQTVSYENRILKSSEIAYQDYLLKKYGSLKKINEVYQWNLKIIEEAFPAFMTAYTITFLNNEAEMSSTPIFANYKLIYDFLFLNGKAIGVTVFLICLVMIATLTINPLCAYALSRFRLPGTAKILLFMLATMAFPAMVSEIPAYLLMRDLGLLNTFFALVLPGAANGMAIFILKGFFDSLPQELYEAATIDGASEIQIFKMVAMPMVKPILAINCVNAFIGAYNGWQWALIICQDKDMWTLAVWMYQASRWWAESPWIVSAGFVVISIPTFIVFISCQKIILRGIVIPSMK